MKFRIIEMGNLQLIFGGMLFLGTFLGIVFVIGAGLILYFKQISEGYEDRINYEIMKKVGLSKEVIKKSLNKQILWIFFMPLIVSAVHLMFAVRLLSHLFLMLGMGDGRIYIMIAGIVLLIFALVYSIFYKITSKVYYKIIN